MVLRLTDVVVPFRTYPHVDMKEAGARACELLFNRICAGINHGTKCFVNWISGFLLALHV